MKRRELTVIVALAAACSEQRSEEGLVVRSPGRLRQALTSMDQALCERLDVALTFDRTDDLAPPPLDRVPLIPKPETPARRVDCPKAGAAASTGMNRCSSP